jgi:sugar phosphate isomerase/epimerase
MKPNRRELLAATVAQAASLCYATAAPAETRRVGMGVVIHSYGARRFGDAAAFLDHCATIGAAGIQTNLGNRPADAAALRDKAAKHGMYLEGIVGLPRDANDVARFSTQLQCAKETGAAVVRTVCLSGRRYETFTTAEQYREFAKRSWDSLKLAEPVAAKHDMKLAVENHKDWRVDELLDILRRLSSRHVGVTLDTGNSIALLEDPMEVIKAYAPFTFTTHFKDMGVSEYEEGFLLSEVPFGEGILDLQEAVSLIRRARPEVRMNLEMMTRDPLKVPCLTRKYWATFETLPGRFLAETLALVRAKKFPRPLPTVRQLERAEQVRVEEENVRKCLGYARDSLRLT